MYIPVILKTFPTFKFAHFKNSIEFEIRHSIFSYCQFVYCPCNKIGRIFSATNIRSLKSEHEHIICTHYFDLISVPEMSQRSTVFCALWKLVYLMKTNFVYASVLKMLIFLNIEIVKIVVYEGHKIVKKWVIFF